MAKKTLEYELRGGGGAQATAVFNQATAGAGKFADRLVQMGLIPPPNLTKHVAVLQKYEQEITAIRNRSAVDQLRNQGRTLDAELMLITQQAEAKKRAVEKSLASQVRRAPDEASATRLVESSRAKQVAIDEAAQLQRAGLIGQDSKAKAEAVAAAAAAKRQADQRDSGDFRQFIQDRGKQRAAVAAGLREAHESGLRRTAEGEGTAEEKERASLELRRLAIQKQFGAEVQKLNGIYAGQGVTIAQRLQAEQAILTVQRAEAEALKKLSPEAQSRLKAQKEIAAFAERMQKKRAGGGDTDANGYEPEDIIENGGIPRGGGGNGFFARLRARTGRRSGLGQVGLILKGGGAIGGATAVASAIGEAGQNYANDRERDVLSNTNTNLTSTFRGKASELVRALPVGKQLYEASVGAMNGFDAVFRPDAFRSRVVAPVDNQRATMIADYRHEQAERSFQSGRAATDFATVARRSTAQAGLVGYSQQRAQIANSGVDQQRSLAEQKRDELYQQQEEFRQKSQKLSEGPYSPLQAEATAVLMKQNSDRKLQIEADYQTKAKAAREQSAAEEAAFNKNHEYQTLREFADYEAQTQMVRTQSAASRLQTLRRGLAAELLTIEAGSKEQVRQIDAETVDRMRNARPEDRAKISAEGADRSRAVQDAAAAARDNVVFSLQRDSTLDAMQAQAAAGNTLAGYESQRLQLLQAMTEKMQALRDAMASLGPMDERRVALAKTLATYEDAQSRSVSEQLRLGRLDVLQAEAEAGSKSAAAERQRLVTAKQFTDEMNRQRSILSDKTSSPDQKIDAQQQLDRLGRAQGGQITAGIRDRQLQLIQGQAQNGRTALDRRGARVALATDAATEGLKQLEADAQKVLRDPAATDEQKRAATANVQRYIQQSGRQYDADVNGPPIERKRTFDGQERGLLLSGVTASQASRDPLSDVVRESKEATKQTRRLADLFERWMRENGVDKSTADAPFSLFGGAN